MAHAALDPVTLELIRNGLQSVVDEMALTLVRTAYSPNLKSAMDLSSALCDARGRLVAQGLTLPLHMGAVPDAMEAFLAAYGDDLRPDDAFVLNDPYEGGTHLPDFFVMQPIFVADALLGFAVTVAHHTDVGGRVPGGNGFDSTEIFQEGFRIPPVRLRARGQLDDTFLRLLAGNVRIPTKVLGDLRAQLAACHIGARGLLDLVERYHADVVAGAFDALLDYTERLARLEIGRLPSGRYTFVDHLDGDGMGSGPIRIQVAVTASHGELDVDFAGSSAQVQGAINCVLSFTKSTVYACVRCLMPPSIPNNEGYFRAIRIHAPAGSIVNPLPPAAVAARGLTGYRIADAVLGALAQLAPERVPACESGGDTGVSLGGVDAEGDPFVFLEFLVCSRGGRPDGDGIDGIASIVVNFSNYPAEVIEREYPLRIEEYGYLRDTGGPGRFRGGLALVRQYRFLQDAGALQVRADRVDYPAYGLAGGLPGAASRSILNPGPDEQVLPAKVSLTVRRGDVLRHELAGAGGWGDPFDREPAALLDDVRLEKITAEHARSAYGVAIDPVTLTLDAAGTERLRSTARRCPFPTSVSG